MEELAQVLNTLRDKPAELQAAVQLLESEAPTSDDRRQDDKLTGRCSLLLA